MIESRLNDLRSIVTRVYADKKPQVMALAIHDLMNELEVVWAGKRTALSNAISVAVAERLRGPSTERILDGFRDRGRDFAVTRDELTMIDQKTGELLNHVFLVLRPKKNARFALSLVFQPGLSVGLRTLIEHETKEELAEALREGLSGTHAIRPKISPT